MRFVCIQNRVPNAKDQFDACVTNEPFNAKILFSIHRKRNKFIANKTKKFHFKNKYILIIFYIVFTLLR